MTTRHGMTLIEVMLAVAILGAGFAVLLTGASRCLAVVRRAHVYQEVQWTLSAGEADHPMFETNAIEDLVVAPYRYDNGLTYSREVGEDLDEDGLYVVTARIAWNARGRELSEDVVSLVYHPGEEDE